MLLEKNGQTEMERTLKQMNKNVGRLHMEIDNLQTIIDNTKRQTYSKYMNHVKAFCISLLLFFSHKHR